MFTFFRRVRFIDYSLKSFSRRYALNVKDRERERERERESQRVENSECRLYQRLSAFSLGPERFKNHFPTVETRLLHRRHGCMCT